MTRKDYVILLLYTVILVIDYFSLVDWISSSVLLWVFVAVVVYSLNYKKYKNISDEDIMKWQIFSTSYFVIAALILYLLGGRSSAGLFFSDMIFILILLLSFFEIFIRWRKWEV